MQKHAVYISAGSNIGNRLLHCQNGIAGLRNSGMSTIKAQSRFYLTEPVGYTEQDWFINAVVKIETVLDPFQLLHELLSIQRNEGRTDNTIRFGPRILDLDILLYDDVVINSSRLVVPHPEMHKRRFVLCLICDIDSAIVHPVLKKTMYQLVADLDDKGQRIFHYK